MVFARAGRSCGGANWRAWAAVAAGLLLSACGGGPEVQGDWYVGERALYHGIPVRVLFAPADLGLAAQAWYRLEAVDPVFNDYREDSEVGRLNRGDGDATVSEPLAEALRLAQQVHGLTGGAFDPTVGPLRRLWRQAAESGEWPDKEARGEALGRCGLDGIRLEGRTLKRQRKGVQLDFGGIVKGMAVDEVVRLLQEAGVRDGLVQVGGETAAFGVSQRRQLHRIGIQHPLAMDQVWTVVQDPGSGISCATSGNYRNPIEIAGRKVYHIFDPRTGEPVDTQVLSVTVVFVQTGQNGLADALSTAGAVLGPERILPIVRELGGEALVLLQDGEEIVERKTAGWDRLVVE